MKVYSIQFEQLFLPVTKSHEKKLKKLRNIFLLILPSSNQLYLFGFLFAFATKIVGEHKKTRTRSHLSKNFLSRWVNHGKKSPFWVNIYACVCVCMCGLIFENRFLFQLLLNSFDFFSFYPLIHLATRS